MYSSSWNINSLKSGRNNKISCSSWDLHFVCRCIMESRGKHEHTQGRGSWGVSFVQHVNHRKHWYVSKSQANRNQDINKILPPINELMLSSAGWDGGGATERGPLLGGWGDSCVSTCTPPLPLPGLTWLPGATLHLAAAGLHAMTQLRFSRVCKPPRGLARPRNPPQWSETSHGSWGCPFQSDLRMKYLYLLLFSNENKHDYGIKQNENSNTL